MKFIKPLYFYQGSSGGNSFFFCKQTNKITHFIFVLNILHNPLFYIQEIILKSCIWNALISRPESKCVFKGLLCWGFLFVVPRNFLSRQRSAHLKLLPPCIVEVCCVLKTRQSAGAELQAVTLMWLYWEMTLRAKLVISQFNTNGVFAENVPVPVYSSLLPKLTCSKLSLKIWESHCVRRYLLSRLYLGLHWHCEEPWSEFGAGYVL